MHTWATSCNQTLPSIYPIVNGLFFFFYCTYIYCTHTSVDVPHTRPVFTLYTSVALCRQCFLAGSVFSAKDCGGLRASRQNGKSHTLAWAAVLSKWRSVVRQSCSVLQTVSLHMTCRFILECVCKSVSIKYKMENCFFFFFKYLHHILILWFPLWFLYLLWQYVFIVFHISCSVSL